MSTQQTAGLKPTRRTLVKGAVWSVPVVAMAAPAHALTCSQDPSQTICNCLSVASAAGCKWPGENDDPRFNKTFRARVCFTADGCVPGGGDASIVFESVNDGGSGGWDFRVSPTSFTVGEGEQICVDVFFRDANSGNRDLFFNYSLNGLSGYQAVASKVFTGGQPECDYNCGGEGQLPCPPYTAEEPNCADA